MRQTHRWLSIVFTVTVVICIVAVLAQQAPDWVFYLPLLPLIGQLVTGLYLFVLPYTARRRAARES
ncbi:hypothetical protein [Nonomuraea antri]|uniref:hypothetical protein n=1 Tax=Nonomuraea antri TaxID=2730852 RepID=UPI001C2BA05B|nr:hypothetical protein [Nonomuraea antri]